MCFEIPICPVLAENVMQKIPKYAYAMAFFSGFFVFLVFLLIRFRSDLSDSQAIGLAIAACSLLSALFAFAWPRALWRWGLWVSSSFWLFLSLVFVSYLLNNQYEWVPAIEALSFAGFASIGAMLGQGVSKYAKRKIIGQ